MRHLASCNRSHAWTTYRTSGGGAQSLRSCVIGHRPMIQHLHENHRISLNVMSHAKTLITSSRLFYLLLKTRILSYTVRLRLHDQASISIFDRFPRFQKPQVPKMYPTPTRLHELIPSQSSCQMHIFRLYRHSFCVYCTKISTISTLSHHTTTRDWKEKREMTHVSSNK
jgi:hypothetical protein